MTSKGGMKANGDEHQVWCHPRLWVSVRSVASGGPLWRRGGRLLASGRVGRRC
jgi:hypothetical protein